MEPGAAALTRERSGDGTVAASGSGDAGREGGSGILVLGDLGLEIDQLEIGTEEAEVWIGGAKEATAVSKSKQVAGGPPGDGGTKEAS